MGQCLAPAAMTSGKTAAATAAAAAAATTPAVIMVTPTRPAAATRPAGPTRPGPELITAAGAAMHDGPPVMQASPRPEPEPEDRSRRAGPAMLLAALALMSGIALRRFSARNQ
jgi:hypothetical protein